jgi:hypothetical protein
MPRLLFNKFGNTAANRWLSMEKQCAKLLSMISFEATDEMLHDLGLMHAPEKLAMILVGARCIHDPSKYSAYIVCINLLVNKVAGGKGGEARKGLLRILGFLGSVEHRISIVILAAWLDIHNHSLAFINGASEVIPDSNIYGNRAIESSVFSRSFLGTIYNIQLNWSSALPLLAAKIKLISLQSTAVPPAECESRWHDYLKTSTSAMYSLAVKYFQDMDLLNIGRSVLYIVCPYMGPVFAQGYLEASLKLNLISPDQAFYTPSRRRAATPSELKTPWKVDSDTRAFPTKSYPEAVEAVKKSFLVSVEGTKDIVKAYALANAGVLKELQSIANESLIMYLRHTDWTAEVRVAKYFTLFKQHFPYLAEVLLQNFSTAMICSTPVEGAFSVIGNIVHPNSSFGLHKQKIDFALRFKGPTLREQRVNVKVGAKPKPKRLLRNIESRGDYLKQLNTVADSFGGNDGVITTKVSKRIGKKEADTINASVYCQKELGANHDTSSTRLISGDDIKAQIGAFDTTKITGKTVFPPASGDELVYSTACSTNITVAKAIIALYSPDIDIKKMKRRRADDDNGKNINDILTNIMIQYPTALHTDTSDEVATKKSRINPEEEE